MLNSPLLPPRASASSFFAPSVVEGGAHMFHPHRTVNDTMTMAVQSAGVGLLVSAVQNALDSHNRGAMGIFTRSGSTIGFFTAMGVSYAFVKDYTANVRETDDALNKAAGGCASGFAAGLAARNLPMAFGACAGMGILMGTFEAAGNSLAGDGRQRESREVREERRLRFFKRPKEATEEAA